MTTDGTEATKVRRVKDGWATEVRDLLAAEEPMEIRLAAAHESGSRVETVAVTMRTPGDDFELAAGFLFTEGIVRRSSDIQSIEHDNETPSRLRHATNVVRVTLREGIAYDAARAKRNFFMTSSCGICGKMSIEAIKVRDVAALPSCRPSIRAEVVEGLPDRLREGQKIFAATGGLHAAGLFDASGTLHSLREDVGRHNAVDKLVGEQLLAGRIPLHEFVLGVSGRGSFEIMQKAAVAGIPVVVAVGAPSSLSVALAQEFGMTLVGFARRGSFNVYSGEERVVGVLA